MRAAIRTSFARHRRFVPPWERDGQTAEDFFAGLMQSSNPLQRQRREKERASAAHDNALRDNGLTAEDLRRAEERARHNDSVLRQQQEFLPYGATPRRYFATTQMAAWGQYESALQTATADSDRCSSGSSTRVDDAPQDDPMTGYSAETRSLLVRDMYDTIPYKYTRYVDPPSPTQRTWPLHGTAAVVFDLDGVIYRRGAIVPGSDSAIQTLHELKVPVMFMTNGSLKSEADKAKELSAMLKVPIRPEQVLLSHSPMRALRARYAHAPVLVVGSPVCGDILRDYGFVNAMTVQQFQCEHPELVPFKRWGELQRAPRGGEAFALAFPRIEAVFQLDVPDDVFNDVQILMDVFTAPQGQIGGRYVSGCQSVPYFVSADDLYWSTDALLPRLGQGAFREMVTAVYESMTGQALEQTMYGKPRAIAFAYATERLHQLTAQLGWDPAHLRAIFMVGDNLETDVLGANAAGGPWSSVHVLSGIGSAPAARRTLNRGDMEQEWLQESVPRLPHYIAPTADHFVRELLAFPEAAILHNKTLYYGRPNPVDLQETYDFAPPH